MWQDWNPCKQSPTGHCLKLLSVNPKLQQTPQDNGDARNTSQGKMEAVNRASPRKPTWAVISETIGAELPMPCRAHNTTPCDPKGRHRATEFNTMLGFGLALVQFLPAIFLPFGMRVFTLCHCVLEVSNLFFYVFRDSQLRVC